MRKILLVIAVLTAAMAINVKATSYDFIDDSGWKWLTLDNDTAGQLHVDYLNFSKPGAPSDIYLEKVFSNTGAPTDPLHVTTQGVSFTAPLTGGYPYTAQFNSSSGSFSVVDAIPAPDPSNTVLLLGLALIGLEGVRRKVLAS